MLRMKGPAAHCRHSMPGTRRSPTRNRTQQSQRPRPTRQHRHSMLASNPCKAYTHQPGQPTGPLPPRDAGTEALPCGANRRRGPVPATLRTRRVVASLAVPPGCHPLAVAPQCDDGAPSPGMWIIWVSAMADMMAMPMPAPGEADGCSCLPGPSSWTVTINSLPLWASRVGGRSARGRHWCRRGGRRW
jgi:hypothetical protein